MPAAARTTASAGGDATSAALPFPVPIEMSGSFAGAPLGVLPFGVTHFDPRKENSAPRSGAVSLAAVSR